MTRMLGAVLAGGALGVVLCATPAAAHTRLTGTEPQADATVTDALDVVVLHFSEAVDQTIAELEIAAPDGSAVGEGPARIDGARVEQPLGELPAAGTYTVSYRVVAADGHALTGEFEFVYEGPVPEDEPEPTEQAAADPTPQPEPEPTDEPDPTPVSEPDDEDRALAAAARPGTDPPGGLLSLTAAVLLAVLAAAGYAVRAVAHWQPQG